MGVLEKITNLLNDVQETGVNEIPAGFGYTKQYITNERVASHLISNGVTVQEWIPVTERTPENIGLYLVIEKHWLDGSSGVEIAKWNNTDWFTADRKSKEITPRVTHWMPLPAPSKEGAEG